MYACTAGGAVAGEVVAEGEVAGGGTTEGIVVTPEDERMIWIVLDGDWREVHGDALMRGLEEMGLRVEVEGAD